MRVYSRYDPRTEEDAYGKLFSSMDATKINPRLQVEFSARGESNAESKVETEKVIHNVGRS